MYVRIYILYICSYTRYSSRCRSYVPYINVRNGENPLASRVPPRAKWIASIIDLLPLERCGNASPPEDQRKLRDRKATVAQVTAKEREPEGKLEARRSEKRRVTHLLTARSDTSRCGSFGTWRAAGRESYRDLPNASLSRATYMIRVALTRIRRPERPRAWFTRVYV